MRLAMLELEAIFAGSPVEVNNNDKGVVADLD